LGGAQERAPHGATNFVVERFYKKSQYRSAEREVFSLLSEEYGFEQHGTRGCPVNNLTPS